MLWLPRADLEDVRGTARRRLTDRRSGGAHLLVLVLGVAVLVVGLGTGASERVRSRTALQASLERTVDQQAASLGAYFERARSIALLTGNNTAFRQFYERPGTREAKVRTGGPAVAGVNDALGYLEQLYPDRIGEACFIDQGGAENARVVRGVVATADDLSPDESVNPFFRPAFQQEPGGVYQSKPYVSPDTGEWVISNATPVRMGDGTAPAIVHYEITIESFRRTAAPVRDEIAVVDARTGDVVIDSRTPQRLEAPLGRPADDRFRSLADQPGDTGRTTIDGRPAAFEHLAPTASNANDWYVVALAQGTTGPLSGTSPFTVGTVLVSLALLAYAIAGSLRARRQLVRDASTDSLTGLSNRRRLLHDLEDALTVATPDHPYVLMLCDLNEFKPYNDTFGHAAGDALLTRLGSALADAVPNNGRAYRLGGDEFCVLAPVGDAGVQPIVGAATEALSERGDAFYVDASYGVVLLPTDTTSATDALQLADKRMYSQKAADRRSPDRQASSALLRVLAERHPEMSDRMEAMSALVLAVAERLQVPGEERRHIAQAAELHDVGKVAIPDAILQKPGPLTEDEMAFIRRHPVIGERIMSSAPALSVAASIVRSTHERVDGTGYPDGLEGDAIPLGARIIAAGDAFTAMTADRPFAPRRDRSEALAELRRHAGRQFDPVVVEAVEAVVEAATPRAARI